MELKKNMENKFTVWTNVMWFCLGVGAVILFAIATTPAHAQASTLYNSGFGTTTTTADNFQYIGTGYSGVISDLYIYGDRYVNDTSNINFEIYRCSSYEDSENSADNCPSKQGTLDSSLISGYSNPIGSGYQYRINSVLLGIEWDDYVILLPDYHYYIRYDFASTTVKVPYTTFDSSFGWRNEELSFEDASLAIEGTGFLGTSYVYNKTPIGQVATNSVDIGFYYNLAPYEDVTGMELRLSATGYSTVILPISFGSNVGSTTNTLFVPAGIWTASVWFTGQNGAVTEWTCTTCSWQFSVLAGFNGGGTGTSTLIWDDQTVGDLLEAGAISTTSAIQQSGDYFQQMINALTNVGLIPMANQAKELFGTVFTQTNTEIPQRENTITLGYHEMNASNSVTVDLDQVNNLWIVSTMREMLGWLLYLSIALALILFGVYAFLGESRGKK